MYRNEEQVCKKKSTTQEKKKKAKDMAYVIGTVFVRT